MGRKKDIRKEGKHVLSAAFPKSLVEEIDIICSANYITRTTWLIRASKEMIEKERKIGRNELIEKIANKESTR